MHLPCLGAASSAGCRQATLGWGNLHLQEIFTFLTVFYLQLKKIITSSYLRIGLFFFFFSGSAVRLHFSPVDWYRDEYGVGGLASSPGSYPAQGLVQPTTVTWSPAYC